MAAFNSHVKIVKLLIAYGANINTENNIILRYAKENNNSLIIKALIGKDD